MAWTVCKGYVAVVAMALAMAPIRKICAEDICGWKERNVFFLLLLILEYVCNFELLIKPFDTFHAFFVKKNL